MFVEVIIKGNVVATISQINLVELYGLRSQCTSEVNRATVEADRSEDEADRSTLEVFNAQARVLTADSYASQPPNEPVRIYVSNGDGTFSSSPTDPIEYSSLHYSEASDAASKVAKAGDTMTGHLVVPPGATGPQVPQKQEIDALIATNTADIATNTAEAINKSAIPQTKKGDLTIGESLDIASWSYTTTTITVNTTQPHNLSVGQYFTVSDLVADTNPPNGRHEVISIVDTDTITFSVVDEPTGTPTIDNAKLVHGDLDALGYIKKVSTNNLEIFVIDDDFIDPYWNGGTGQWAKLLNDGTVIGGSSKGEYSRLSNGEISYLKTVAISFDGVSVFDYLWELPIINVEPEGYLYGTNALITAGLYIMYEGAYTGDTVNVGFQEAQKTVASSTIFPRLQMKGRWK